MLKRGLWSCGWEVILRRIEFRIFIDRIRRSLSGEFIKSLAITPEPNIMEDDVIRSDRTVRYLEMWQLVYRNKGPLLE